MAAAAEAEEEAKEAEEEMDSHSNPTLNNKLKHPLKNDRSQQSQKIDLAKGAIHKVIKHISNSFSRVVILQLIIYTLTHSKILF